MIVIGITGSFASGKSTVSAFFEHNGMPVYNADAHVHNLYEGPLRRDILALFPQADNNGQVNRSVIRDIVFDDHTALKRLEARVHPVIRGEQKAFLHRCLTAGTQSAVLDIPLLFELQTDIFCDVCIVTSVSKNCQEERALERPGMTTSLLKKILRRQMPEAEKRRRAHFVIDTTCPKIETRAQVTAICRALSAVRGQGKWRML